MHAIIFCLFGLLYFADVGRGQAFSLTYENEAPALPGGPFTSAWKASMKSYPHDVLRLLDSLERPLSDASSDSLENLAGKIRTEGFIVYEFLPNRQGALEARVIISPLVVLDGTKYSLEANLRQDMGMKTIRHSITARQIVKASVKEWLRNANYERGSFMDVIKRRVAKDSLQEKAHSQIDSITIEFDHEGEFNNETDIWGYLVTITEISAQALPVTSRKLEFFGVSGLRTATQSDGTKFEPTGKVIRGDFQSAIRLIGRDRFGGAIWQR